MNELLLTVFDTDDAQRFALLKTLAHHQNAVRRWSNGEKFRQLFISLCDESGQLFGEVHAYTHGIWLDIEFMWVNESLRKCLHGSRMLAVVEAEARFRRCNRSYLDTKGSDSAGFFLVCGYSICGELTSYRNEQSRYWLHKQL